MSDTEKIGATKEHINMPALHKVDEIDTGPEIPENLLQIAIKQGEDPNLKCAYIQELRDMIFEVGKCKPFRTDDEFLIKFLRARYWKISAAYNLLCNYCEFRENNRNLHEKVNPASFQSVGDQDIVSVAPLKDQFGHRIIIYKFGKWQPALTTVDDIFRATLILLELGSLEPSAQILGGIGIFDISNLALSQVFHLTPSVAQKMMSLMVTCMPVRTTAIHIVNDNWVFNAAFKMFKPFLNAKMRERVFIHGSDMSSLHQHIEPKYLPIRYGGQQEDFPYMYWIDKLHDNEHILKELRTVGYLFDTKDGKRTK